MIKMRPNNMAPNKNIMTMGMRPPTMTMARNKMNNQWSKMLNSNRKKIIVHNMVQTRYGVSHLKKNHL